jgi:hypothetical protein
VRRNVATVLYLLAMVALIVCLDVFFLSHHFVARLIVNVAIVLVFLLGYFLLMKRAERPGR